MPPVPQLSRSKCHEFRTPTSIHHWTVALYIVCTLYVIPPEAPTLRTDSASGDAQLSIAHRRQDGAVCWDSGRRQSRHACNQRNSFSRQHLGQLATGEGGLRVGAADGALQRDLHHRQHIRQRVLHSTPRNLLFLQTLAPCRFSHSTSRDLSCPGSHVVNSCSNFSSALSISEVTPQPAPPAPPPVRSAAHAGWRASSKANITFLASKLSTVDAKIRPPPTFSNANYTRQCWLHPCTLQTGCKGGCPIDNHATHGLLRPDSASRTAFLQDPF